MITVELYLSQHAEAAEPGELTDEKKQHAKALVDAVNNMLAVFLDETGLARVLRSGWRPVKMNATFLHTDGHGNVVRGGATNSPHTTCEGVDLADNDGKLDEWLTDEKLEQFGLYREHPSATPSWCHVQTRAPHSGHRTFYP